MSEIYRPKKTFARSTIAAVVFIAILNVLVNISFVRTFHLLGNNIQTLTSQLCAVSVNAQLYDSLDMATLFFRDIFGNDLAERVMSGIIAFSIFGNIVVMTFTASRGMVQQAYTNRIYQRPLISVKSNRKLPKRGYFHFLSSSLAAPR